MTQRSGATISAHEHVAMIPPAMENRPRVSFIIPTLNTEAILEICLVAIARQTYPRDRYEIILANAHSKDRTREIAKNTAPPFSTTTAKTLRKANGQQDCCR